VVMAPRNAEPRSRADWEEMLLQRKRAPERERKNGPRVWSGRGKAVSTLDAQADGETRIFEAWWIKTGLFRLFLPDGPRCQVVLLPTRNGGPVWREKKGCGGSRVGFEGKRQTPGWPICYCSVSRKRWGPAKEIAETGPFLAFPERITAETIKPGNCACENSEIRKARVVCEAMWLRWVKRYSGKRLLHDANRGIKPVAGFGTGKKSDKIVESLEDFGHTAKKGENRSYTALGLGFG